MTHCCLSLAFVFTLLSAGSSLICYECFNSTGTYCRGSPITCPSTSTSCIKTVEIARIGNAILKSFSRGCNDNEQLCNKDVIMNSGAGNKVIRIVNTCCHEDYCNDCIVRAPPYNVTLNTLLCPVCFKHSSYRCSSSGYIKCRGLETQCMNIAATLVRKDNSTFKFSLMGCNTQDGCSAGPKMMPTSKVVDVTRLSCVPALPITH